MKIALILVGLFTVCIWYAWNTFAVAMTGMVLPWTYAAFAAVVAVGGYAASKAFR